MSQTRHPAPHTPHPTSHTPHPRPKTQNPKAKTLHQVAAMSVAKRVAEEFGCRLGQEVGYPKP